jgi:hypothetical protein
VAFPATAAGQPFMQSPQATPPPKQRRPQVEGETAKAMPPKRQRVHHAESEPLAGSTTDCSETEPELDPGSDLEMYVQQLKFCEKVYKHLGLPGDLKDLVDRRAQEPALHEAFPWLVMVEAGLKFKTWRDALEKELKHKLQRKELLDNTIEITAEELRQLLFQACKNIHNKPGIDRDWIHHWNRVRGHGPVAFMKSLKIIQAHKDSAEHEKMALGKDSNKWYEPCAASLSHQVLKGIINIIGGGIVAVRRMMPTNMQQLLQALDAMRFLLARAGVIEQDDLSYSALWMCRTIMVAEMQFASATIQIYKAPHAPPECLNAQRLIVMGQALPDARNRLGELEKELGIKDISQLQRFLGWQQMCPSLVTMYLCIFNERHLQQSKKVDWIRLLTEVQ